MLRKKEKFEFPAKNSAGNVKFLFIRENKAKHTSCKFEFPAKNCAGNLKFIVSMQQIVGTRPECWGRGPG